MWNVVRIEYKDYYLSLFFFCTFRGLFEKDKLVYSCMLCADIMKEKEEISDAEWNFFLRGIGGIEKVW